LEGAVHGPITAFGATVEHDGRVEGDINANEIHIRGRVKGNLRAKHIYLFASGEVDGDVIASSMVIEEGSRCFGNIKQEKYGVAKPIIKRVESIAETYTKALSQSDAQVYSVFVETAERMGPQASFRDVADTIMDDLHAR
jgi:cytoskeletal protein CcmA (bactofilin family)